MLNIVPLPDVSPLPDAKTSPMRYRCEHFCSDLAKIVLGLVGATPKLSLSIDPRVSAIVTEANEARITLGSMIKAQYPDLLTGPVGEHLSLLENIFPDLLKTTNPVELHEKISGCVEEIRHTTFAICSIAPGAVLDENHPIHMMANTVWSGMQEAHKMMSQTTSLQDSDSSSSAILARSVIVGGIGGIAALGWMITSSPSVPGESGPPSALIVPHNPPLRIVVPPVSIPLNPSTPRIHNPEKPPLTKPTSLECSGESDDTILVKRVSRGEIDTILFLLGREKGDNLQEINIIVDEAVQNINTHISILQGCSEEERTAKLVNILSKIPSVRSMIARRELMLVIANMMQSKLLATRFDPTLYTRIYSQIEDNNFSWSRLPSPKRQEILEKIFRKPQDTPMSLKSEAQTVGEIRYEIAQLS